MIWLIDLLHELDALMLKQLTSEAIPRALCGPVLVDNRNIPRYWATIWALLDNADLAESTQIAKLRAVDELYEHYDAQHQQGALDLAISRIDDEALAEALESWFVTLSNQPKATQSTEFRWKTGVAFITSIRRWLSGGSPESPAMSNARSRWTNLAQLYRNLHVPKPKRTGQIRALPSNVIEALYHVLDPSSRDNPFERPRAKWNAYVAFVLLLHQGLRRGELLLLPADAIKESYDSKKRERRYWAHVRDNPYEDNYLDPRYSKPSVKTQHSIRTVPVSKTIATIVDAYTSNYRGKPNHSFLLNSQKIFLFLMRH